MLAGEIEKFGADDFHKVDEAGGIDVEASWGAAKHGLSELVGRLVRIKFYLKDANLYSFQVQ